MPLSVHTGEISRTALDELEVPHILLDWELRIVALNNAACRLLERTPAEMEGRPFASLCSPAGDCDAADACPEGLNWTADAVTGDGRMVPVELTRSVVSSSQGPGYLIGIREAAPVFPVRSTPLAPDAHSHSVLETVSDAVLICDHSGTIVFANRAARLLLDHKRRALPGAQLNDVLRLRNPQHRKQLAAASYQVLKNGGVVHLHESAQLLRRKSEAVGVDAKIVAVIEPNGEIGGYAAVLRDVSSERRMQALLSFKASHDELTGLVNRREFEHRLHDLFLRTVPEKQPGSVIVIDLDRFKLVNDSHGHMVGDLLLRQLSEALLGEVRGSDTLARIGGDRFAVLLPGCDRKAALQTAESLHTAAAVFRFPWQGKPIQVGVSIGVATIDPQMLSPGDVMTAADAALALAKENGRDRILLYQPEGVAEQRQRGEVLWANRIREAVESDRLRLYCQPILPLHGPTNGGWSCEILVRMLDEGDRLIPPMAFIPAAERYDLMPLVDRWVIGAVVDHWRSHPQTFARIEKCNINLSGQSLAHAGFLSFVLDAFGASGFPLSKVCFEITETAVVADMANAQRLIQELSSRGCRFALDDFGSGLSSFTYLKHLPVDYLKIDGSFVQDMLNDPMDAAMVRAIAEVGQALGLKTIAEFVENPATIADLRRAGVDYGQGFGIQTPFAIHELADYRPRTLD